MTVNLSEQAYEDLRENWLDPTRFHRSMFALLSSDVGWLLPLPDIELNVEAGYDDRTFRQRF
jgi:hypothetical protein